MDNSLYLEINTVYNNIKIKGEIMNLLQILEMLDGLSIQEYEDLLESQSQEGLEPQEAKSMKNNPNCKCRSCVCDPKEKNPVKEYNPNNQKSELNDLNDLNPMETLNEIFLDEQSNPYMEDGDKIHFDGGFLTIYEKHISDQKHLNGVPWDIFDIYRLAMPYIKKEEITVMVFDDYISVEVILDEDISENEDRPFAVGGYQEIPLNEPSHIQAEFKNGYLEILIKPKEVKSTKLEIL